MDRIEPFLKEIDKFEKISKHFSKSYQLPQNVVNTGITAIDDMLDGLIDTDFVVIGSETGVGKTAIACNIAEHVAKSGSKCALFALESYYGEISDRIKFPKIQEKIRQENLGSISFKKWKRGYYSTTDLVTEIEEKIYEESSDEFLNNLFIRYRKNYNYSVSDFLREIKALTELEDIKMIIIDHLHYFHFSDEKSENRAIKEIVGRLRDYVAYRHIPIILFSHLRKTFSGKKALVPQIEEFHGSSEITKNATAVITFSPCYDINMPSSHECPTYIYCPKSRFDGSVKRYVAVPVFDLKKSAYSDKYHLYKLTSGGTEREEIPSYQMPKWAVNVKPKNEAIFV